MAKYKTKSIGGGMEKLVHRLVVEEYLGRTLLTEEHVHHIDGNPINNNINNLHVCSPKEHAILHAEKDVRDDGYDPKFHAYCSMCKTYFLKEMFPKSKNRWNGVHNLCKPCVSSYKKTHGYNVDKFDKRAKYLQQVRRLRKKELNMKTLAKNVKNMETVFVVSKEGRRL